VLRAAWRHTGCDSNQCIAPRPGHASMPGGARDDGGHSFP